MFPARDGGIAELREPAESTRRSTPFDERQAATANRSRLIGRAVAQNWESATNFGSSREGVLLASRPSKYEACSNRGSSFGFRRGRPIAGRDVLTNELESGAESALPGSALPFSPGRRRGPRHEPVACHDYPFTSRSFR